MAPWLDVAMDLVGSLLGNDYIFVIVDYYSRYKEIKIFRVITSTAFIKTYKTYLAVWVIQFPSLQIIANSLLARNLNPFVTTVEFHSST